MEARPVPANAPTPDAVEFVRFCFARRRVGWPELYDEMCGVAGRGLFRGWNADDLAEHGIAFGLFEMPRLAAFVSEIVAADRARAKAIAMVRDERAVVVGPNAGVPVTASAA